MKKLNLVGSKVGRFRYQRGWTQDMLAAKLQLAGWMVSRSKISRIESGLSHVYDFHLFFFANVFNVEVTTLFQKIEPKEGLQNSESYSGLVPVKVPVNE